MVRFSDDEWEMLTSRARDAGMAVGAWIGEVSVEVASGHAASLDLPDLLRLHADVVQAAALATVDDRDRPDVDDLLRRLDAAVDAVVVEIERGRR